MSLTANGKLLRISSEDRQVGESNSDFSVVLNNAPWVQNVRGFVVKSVSFKHIFPNIYDGNNTFTFRHNGSTDESVTIPIGWYDATTLAAALETAINALPAVVNSMTIILSVGTSSSEKRYTFTMSGGDTIQLLKKNSSIANNSMAHPVGINEDSIDAAIVTADSLPDLGGLNTAYICSADLASSNSSASSNNGESVPIITEVPITSGFTQQVHYRSYDDSLDTIIYHGKRSFTKISFQLCTRSGQVLDLRQHNLTIMLKMIPSGFRPID